MTSMSLVRPHAAVSASSDALVSRAPVGAILPLGESRGALTLRAERAGDVPARERLLDAAFGPERFAKTSEALRAGRLPAERLALSAIDGGELAGTVRLWNVACGDTPALLLGPLAVAGSHRSLGVGGALMRHAIAQAEALGHGAILLVGDEPYYQRFGFSAGLTQALDLPGPVDRARFLALELRPGALDGAQGLVIPTGRRTPRARGASLTHRRAA